jgi:hypothetical protein
VNWPSFHPNMDQGTSGVVENTNCLVLVSYITQLRLEGASVLDAAYQGAPADQETPDRFL